MIKTPVSTDNLFWSGMGWSVGEGIQKPYKRAAKFASDRSLFVLVHG